MGHDPFEILEALLTLVDPHHTLGPVEIHHAQSVANQDPGSVFFGGSDGVLQIEDHPVRSMQAGVDIELGFVSGQVESAAAQAIALTAVGALVAHRQQKFSGDFGTGAARGGFQAGSQGERQGALVLHTDPGVFHSERAATLLDQSAYPLAEHAGYLALQIDGHTARIPDLHFDPAVGPDPRSLLSGFTGSGHASPPFLCRSQGPRVQIAFGKARRSP